jgi:hypothetical protein
LQEAQLSQVNCHVLLNIAYPFVSGVLRNNKIAAEHYAFEK